jgi:hypothetical protein
MRLLLMVLLMVLITHNALGECFSFRSTLTDFQLTTAWKIPSKWWSWDKSYQIAKLRLGVGFFTVRLGNSFEMAKFTSG